MPWGWVWSEVDSSMTLQALLGPRDRDNRFPLPKQFPLSLGRPSRGLLLLCLPPVDGGQDGRGGLPTPSSTAPLLEAAADAVREQGWMQGAALGDEQAGRCNRRTGGGSSWPPRQEVLDCLSLLLCSRELLGQRSDGPLRVCHHCNPQTSRATAWSRPRLSAARTRTRSRRRQQLRPFVEVTEPGRNSEMSIHSEKMTHPRTPPQRATPGTWGSDRDHSPSARQRPHPETHGWHVVWSKTQLVFIKTQRQVCQMQHRL